jgi:hypothetical protein
VTLRGRNRALKLAEFIGDTPRKRPVSSDHGATPVSSIRRRSSPVARSRSTS